MSRIHPGTPIDEALPTRTVTSNYAVGGNPLTTSVSDATGTITSTADRLGGLHRRAWHGDHVDVHAGRHPGREATTGGGGGNTSTVGYTYTPTGQVDTVTLDGATVAQHLQRTR